MRQRRSEALVVVDLEVAGSARGGLEDKLERFFLPLHVRAECFYVIAQVLELVFVQLGIKAVEGGGFSFGLFRLGFGIRVREVLEGFPGRAV